MLIVTGATGRLGSQIVDRLLERVHADEVGVSVRDVGKAAALAERGVRVRGGDFTDPPTLAAAFEGADQVLVVSAAIRGGSAFEANRAAIDAASAAGARRILYTSHQAASQDSLFPPQQVHAATEQYLTQLGISFTALRNGFYASTLGMYLGDAFTTGTIVLPEDGPVSWTAHSDLAEVAAIALSDESALDGVTPPLTAPDMLDFAAVADLISDITGRPITRVVADDAEWTASAIERGMPPQAADFSLGMFRAARRNEFAVTGPTLATIIGHPPTSVRTILENLAAPA
ncbi:NAD(P)H-binding protein [Lapillicoccus sp.]|uniref:NmrA family NAD(P)-binding protein n=1 Tax=Lapillicoccus sp. TaxID=1909287 RepID=UPI0039833EC2